MNEKWEQVLTGLSLVALALVCTWAVTEGFVCLGLLMFFFGIFFVAVKGGLSHGTRP